MVRILRAEISGARPDLEEATGQEGADDEAVAAYGVVTTQRPSGKGERDERRKYVSSAPVQTRAKANPYLIVN